jgi:acyl dehydratase
VPGDRPPDAVLDLATPGRDNTIFQLGGEFIEAVKGELVVEGKPMLRGVCSFGLAGRAVLKLTCNNQPERLLYLGLRYIAPVFADEVLRAEVWFLESGRAAFRVSCTDRNAVVMDNGLVEYTSP